MMYKPGDRVVTATGQMGIVVSDDNEELLVNWGAGDNHVYHTPVDRNTVILFTDKVYTPDEITLRQKGTVIPDESTNP